jgi:hypothetical protein
MDPLSFGIMASGLLAAGGAVAQGVSANADSKTSAKAEKEALLDRTDQRLQELRQLRGAQRVSQAASGMALNTGTFASIERTRERDFTIAQGTDSVATKQRIGALRSQGKTALATGIGSAVLGIAGSAMSLMKQGPVLAPRKAVGGGVGASVPTTRPMFTGLLK